MNEKKRVILINGSPKPDKNQSVSETLLTMQEEQLKAAGFHIDRMNAGYSLNHDCAVEDFEAINNAEAVIFTFPLYVFCLPGVLIQYLQDYHQYFIKNHSDLSNLKIYAVVNCGFTEAYINEEAIRVIQSFSRQIGAKFRFGVSLGGGGMVLGAANQSYMKKTMTALEAAFLKITEDITADETGTLTDVMIPLGVPRKLYYFFGDMGWRQLARKNNLKKKELYKKPYYSGK